MNFPPPYPPYTKVIAIIEKSSGGETNGDMWFETKSFTRKAPIEDIIRWAFQQQATGRLILTIDENIEVPEFHLKDDKPVQKSDSEPVKQNTTETPQAENVAQPEQPAQPENVQPEQQQPENIVNMVEQPQAPEIPLEAAMKLAQNSDPAEIIRKINKQ